jgi:hypothetical protein
MLTQAMRGKPLKRRKILKWGFQEVYSGDTVNGLEEAFKEKP